MTKKYRKILVAVDNSDDAQLAFEYAIYRSKLADCALTIATIMEDNDFNSFEVLSKDYMEEKRHALEADLLKFKKVAEESGVRQVDTFLTENDQEAGETIVKKLIPDLKPDLLVIGSRSKKGVGKYFGSQASYMVRHAPISVVVVR